jgi:hypothetical protein
MSTVEYLQEITCITVEEYLQQLFGALFDLVNNAKQCLKLWLIKIIPFFK